jgi:hypothetical protein
MVWYGTNVSHVLFCDAKFAILVVVGQIVMHCTENLIYVFPEVKLRGLIPNFYIHEFVSDLYTFPGSVCLFGCSRILADRSCEYVNRSQIHECGNWETEHYNSVLEIARLYNFISGNTEIRTRHLYWTIIDPSFAVCVNFFSSLLCN